MSTTVNTQPTRTTPGVYITEIPAFGTAIVGVATAVPIFIGYTQFAGDPTTGTSLYNKPIQLTSLADYQRYFGGAAPANFKVTLAYNPNPPSGGGSASVQAPPANVSFYAYSLADNGATPNAMEGFALAPTALPGEPNQFNLYWGIQAFFANGGGNCFVVSVGSYWEGELPTSAPPYPLPPSWIPGVIAKADLAQGLEAAGLINGPTMIVMPEACQLSTYAAGQCTDHGYNDLVCGMLEQAGVLQDRVAILDLPGCLAADGYDALTTCQNALSVAVAPQAAYLSYGAAYAPALQTSVIDPGSIIYTNLQSSDNTVINNILSSQAYLLYNGNPSLATIQSAIAQAFPLPTGSAASNGAANCNDPSTYLKTLSSWTNSPQQQTALDNFLLAALPIFGQIEQLIANQMNVLPPSVLMAGVWTQNDNLNGVWNAPANVALASVSAPLYAMSDAQQSGFNVPINGESICIIRSQINRGNVVWGARTLDGNSLDYRYIQVRRTLIYVEQSIKQALQPYVFAPNDSVTWSTVTSAISSFLTDLWEQGGLMGSKPTEAFGVLCGLGSTMSSQDILDGYMRVAVTLQMIHPAEFIELTFTQSMGS